MVFENWVKNIQAAAYNGARTVLEKLELKLEKINGIQKHARKVRKIR